MCVCVLCVGIKMAMGLTGERQASSRPQRRRNGLCSCGKIGLRARDVAADDQLGGTRKEFVLGNGLMVDSQLRELQRGHTRRLWDKKAGFVQLMPQGGYRLAMAGVPKDGHQVARSEGQSGGWEFSVRANEVDSRPGTQLKYLWQGLGHGASFGAGQQVLRANSAAPGTDAHRRRAGHGTGAAGRKGMQQALARCNGQVVKSGES